MNAYSSQAFPRQTAPIDAPFERSTYRRSHKADPIASIGALAIGLTTLAAFVFMTPAIVKKDKREATIVTLLELPDDPPPATKAPPPPQQEAPRPQPAIVAPAPVVPIAPPPALAAPAPSPQPVTPAPKAAAPAVSAPLANGPQTMDDMSARIVFRRPIRVPVESRRAHEEGIVVLSVLLAVDGRVSDISIASSSGFPRLDRAVLDAVRDWRWSPLILGGSPVMVRGLVRVPVIREHGSGGRDGRRGHGHHGDREQSLRDSSDIASGDGPVSEDRS